MKCELQISYIRFN